jgi:iron complex transport system ATP-binding protein
MDVVLTGRTAHISLTASPSRHDEEVARAALERMDIADLADRPYTELSGGERQLVLIARALGPRTASPHHGRALVASGFRQSGPPVVLIKTLVLERDLAVLMSSHFPNHAFACASRVGLIKDGRLAALGTRPRCLTETSLEDIYGIPVRILNGDPRPIRPSRVCAARAV